MIGLRAPRLRIALAVCLTLWSMGAPLRAAIGAPLEICAEGGLRVVFIDMRTGAPAEPAAMLDCEQCQVCAAMIVAPPRSSPAWLFLSRVVRNCGGGPGVRRGSGSRRRARAPPRRALRG